MEEEEGIIAEGDVISCCARGGCDAMLFCDDGCQRLLTDRVYAFKSVALSGLVQNGKNNLIFYLVLRLTPTRAPPPFPNFLQDTIGPFVFHPPAPTTQDNTRRDVFSTCLLDGVFGSGSFSFL